MKRQLHTSRQQLQQQQQDDADCSDTDVFYEDSVDMLKDRSPSQSCHRSDRKRRRGVIEKRRRDRINNSLTELRRLVPAAFEKQDSAKLEKAEILQMTVDHLKTLHAKASLGDGSADYNFDSSLAVDCRLVGFRECVAEVSRYLVSVEGLDIHDPLRLRLVSHLQCYSAQREAAAKAAAASGSNSHLQSPAWSSSYGARPVTQSHQSYLPTPNGASVHQQQILDHSAAASYLEHSRFHQNMLDAATPPGHGGGSASGGGGGGVRSMTSSHGITAPTSQPTQHHQLGQHTSLLAGLPPVHHTSQFLHSTAAAAAAAAATAASSPCLSMLSPNSLGYGATSGVMLAQGVKPYRPWGAELAY